MSAKSTKESRKKFGHADGPLPCTRLMARDLGHNFTGIQDANAVLIIDDVHGTITGANVYDANFGAGYDPKNYASALPEPGSDRWKKYAKKGYTEVEDLTDERFASLIDVLEMPAETKSAAKTA